MKKYLIVQPWGMGDTIMAAPMAKVLIDSNSPPNIISFLSGSPGAVSFLKLTFPKSKAHYFNQGQRSLWYTLTFFFELRKEKYDAAFLAVNISFLYALLLKIISNIPEVHWEGNSRLLKYLGVKCYKNRHGHRVVRNLILAGIQENCTPKDWPTPAPHLNLLFKPCLPPSIKKWLDVKSKIILIHPGSSIKQSATKRPPASLLNGVVTASLRKNSELKFIFIFGPDEFCLSSSYNETEYCNNLELHNIEEAVYIISAASLLIAGDSGYGHLAASIGIPVITLAGPTDIETTKPWSTLATVIKTRDTLKCMPCYGTLNFSNCPNGLKCMNSISTDDVTSKIEEIINENN